MKKLRGIVITFSVCAAALFWTFAGADASKVALQKPQDDSLQVENEAIKACKLGLGRYKDRERGFAACKEAAEKHSVVARVSLSGRIITFDFKDPMHLPRFMLFLTTNAEGTKRIGP